MLDKYSGWFVVELMPLHQARYFQNNAFFFPPCFLFCVCAYVYVHLHEQTNLCLIAVVLASNSFFHKDKKIKNHDGRVFQGGNSL